MSTSKGTLVRPDLARAQESADREVWRAQLEAIPTWLIRETLDQRRFTAPDPVIRLPGLVGDPVGSLVVFGTDEYQLTGRMMEVLYTLAQATAAGWRRLQPDVLATRVYRGFDREGALQNLHPAISTLNRRIPGLLLMTERRGLGYGRARR